MADIYMAAAAMPHAAWSGNAQKGESPRPWAYVLLCIQLRHPFGWRRAAHPSEICTPQVTIELHILVRVRNKPIPKWGE